MNEPIPAKMLKSAIEAHNTVLCVGLDPDPRRFPDELLESGLCVQEQTWRFLRVVVDRTAPHTCAFKPQKAFFDAIPGGGEILAEIVQYIKREAPGRPVFVDCKIGDTGNTMAAYLQNLLGCLDADGAVVNPYMGKEVLEPFMSTPDKAAIVLVRTSNPGAEIIQDAPMHDGRPLWQHVLRFAREFNCLGNIFPAISCGLFCSTGELEQCWPKGSPVLMAGYGAQGGRLTPTPAALSHVVFVNSSRAILYPMTTCDTKDWGLAIAAAAENSKVALNQWRHESQELIRSKRRTMKGVTP